jgi:hypothetical protein
MLFLNEKTGRWIMSKKVNNCMDGGEQSDDRKKPASVPLRPLQNPLELTMGRHHDKPSDLRVS